MPFGLEKSRGEKEAFVHSRPGSYGSIIVMSEDQSLGRIAELSFQLVHDEIKLAGAFREFSSKYISGSTGAPHAG